MKFRFGSLSGSFTYLFPVQLAPPPPSAPFLPFFLSGLRPMRVGRLSGCCFPKQCTRFKRSRDEAAEADDAKHLN